MTRARGRGRGVTRGRSLSQPGRGVRGGVRGRVRDRRSTGLVQLQVDLLNQQAAQENEAGLDDMVVDPHPPSPNNATSDGEWDWEEDHTSQRVEQGGARGNIIGTAEQVGIEEQNNEGEQILLADRLYPEVPVPRDVNEEDHWLQLCYPTHIQAAAERMDQILWEVLEMTSSSSIPRSEEGKIWECVVNVPGLQRRTFQDWVVRQPVKLAWASGPKQTSVLLPLWGRWSSSKRSPSSSIVFTLTLNIFISSNVYKFRFQ